MNKQEKIKVHNKKLLELENKIKDLINSFIYEPYTEFKDLLETEITKMVKSKNLFSHFGGKYKTILNIDPIDNYIKIDVRTDDGKWRLMKCDFFIYNKHQ